jgi:predicted transcriptional regulator
MQLKFIHKVSFEIHNNFLFPFSIENHKVFEKFNEDKGGEMMEERIDENTNESVTVEASPSTESTIGIGELMGKRAKLEEAIDYVGLMIKNLKDKRTMLEKDIEEESVDIKNLKEKLQKVSEYIDEENRGIQELSDKRMKVENEAGKYRYNCW